MRLSVRKNDIGYDPCAFLAVVTLNGEQVKNCFTADEELGEVNCYVYPLCLDSTGEDLQEIVMHGDVVISFPVGDPMADSEQYTA